MSEMIERVAKALFDAEQADRFQHVANYMIFGREGPITWEYVTGPEVRGIVADTFRAKARLAIEAMREPNKGIRGCMKRLSADDRGNYVGNDIADFYWEELINEALK